jgi:3-oxoacyl-[acyl-carrier-protein] synthase III
MNFASRITGTGSAFPKNRVANDDLVEKLAKFGAGLTYGSVLIRW